MKLWIAADDEEKDRKFLEELGVVVGQFNKTVFRNCEVSDEAHAKLDAYWGRFVWGEESDGSPCMP